MVENLKQYKYNIEDSTYARPHYHTAAHCIRTTPRSSTPANADMLPSTIEPSEAPLPDAANPQNIQITPADRRPPSHIPHRRPWTLDACLELTIRFAFDCKQA
jgi:hypothetical protein